MKVLVLVFLTVLSAKGYPQKRSLNQPPQTSQHLQQYSNIQRHLEQLHPSLDQIQIQRAREPGQRDCKGKCASTIAQKAAAEAKAAQAAQNAAGAQAAHMVKTQLAEKALQAAKAAEAALAGKQAVVEQLQQEVKEAEAVVAENTAAVHQQQGTVNAAVVAAQQASALLFTESVPPQHKMACQSATLAAQVERSANCVLEKTKFGLQEKCHNLSEARARLAHLQHKLQCACAECAATKQAAHCACEAARAACGNARKRRRSRSSQQRKRRKQGG